MSGKLARSVYRVAGVDVLSGARSALKPLCKQSESLKGNCDMDAQQAKWAF
jgi:hypothetical protein